jgi:hypothetical protein
VAAKNEVAHRGATLHFKKIPAFKPTKQSIIASKAEWETIWTMIVDCALPAHSPSSIHCSFSIVRQLTES